MKSRRCMQARQAQGGRSAIIGRQTLTGSGDAPCPFSCRWSPAQRWQWLHQTLARWPMVAYFSARPQFGQGSPSRPYTSSSCSK
ncbi:hypothetical protein STENO_003983 [Stenotrophomonas maltophilia]